MLEMWGHGTLWQTRTPRFKMADAFSHGLSATYTHTQTYIYTHENTDTHTQTHFTRTPVNADTKHKHTHTHTHTHFWEYNHRIPQHFSLNSRDRFTLLVNFTHEYSLRKCAMTILNTEWFYGVCEVQWNFHKAGYVSLLLLNSCHFIFTDRFF